MGSQHIHGINKTIILHATRRLCSFLTLNGIDKPYSLKMSERINFARQALLLPELKNKKEQYEWLALHDFGKGKLKPKIKRNVLKSEFEIDEIVLQRVSGMLKIKTQKEYEKYSKVFFKMKYWNITLRNKVIEAYGNECLKCKKEGRKSIGTIHIDHIYPRSKFHRLELSIENLQPLCESCNINKSNTDYSDYRDYTYQQWMKRKGLNIENESIRIKGGQIINYIYLQKDRNPIGYMDYTDETSPF